MLTHLLGDLNALVVFALGVGLVKLDLQDRKIGNLFTHCEVICLGPHAVMLHDFTKLVAWIHALGYCLRVGNSVLTLALIVDCKCGGLDLKLKIRTVAVNCSKSSVYGHSCPCS